MERTITKKQYDEIKNRLPHIELNVTCSDWKTAKNKPSEMSMANRYQATLYAFGLIAKGYEVNTIRIVYIQRPTNPKKTAGKPAQVWIFEEPLTNEFLSKIIDTVELVKGTINTVKKYPELESIIFRENPMKLY